MQKKPFVTVLVFSIENIV